MPNWCDCELRVIGKTKEVKLFKEFAKSDIDYRTSDDGKDENVLDTNNFIPYPKYFKDLDDKAKEHNEKAQKLTGKAREKFKHMKDGFNSGGYEWCSENWGTKWGICRAELTDEYTWELEGEERNDLNYSFETAWSPPCPLVVRMSVLFPSLTFELRYFESGGGFNGLFVCEKGKIIDDKQGEYFGNRGG